MNIHNCLLGLGSNLDGAAQLASARRALLVAFPDIRFSNEFITEAIGSGLLSPFHNQTARFTTSLDTDDIRSVLKAIEQAHGRLSEDKAKGIVKLDIDLLTLDKEILKPADMEREFVKKGIKELSLH